MLQLCAMNQSGKLDLNPRRSNESISDHHTQIKYHKLNTSSIQALEDATIECAGSGLAVGEVPTSQDYVGGESDPGSRRFW